jgi:hypothetical protein
VYILNLIDIACASIVASMPAYYSIFNSFYQHIKKALGLTETLPTASPRYVTSKSNSVFSYMSRMLHSRRHAPSPSPHLSNMKGNYYLSSEHSEHAGGGLVTSVVGGNNDAKDLECEGIMVTDEFEMDERHAKDADITKLPGQAL